MSASVSINILKYHQSILPVQNNYIQHLDETTSAVHTHTHTHTHTHSHTHTDDGAFALTIMLI